MVLALSMVVGMLSGCGLGKDKTPDAVVQDVVTEVEEVTLSSKGQDTFLLSAGQKPELQFDTTSGEITDVTVTPNDKTLVPYQYYTVTITLTAGDNENFAKSAVITLDGVELQVKEWAEDKLVIEYTTLALPETVTTDEMSEVTDYGTAASENSLGTAKVQALLDCDLTIFSEDGSRSYVVKKGFIPLFMVPSFVANGEPEQIGDGESVQIIKEHGEEDFPGAAGEWYKIAYRGKVGYVPVTFIKDVKIVQNNSTPEPAATPKKVSQTRPAAKPEVVQNTQTTAGTADNNSGNTSGSSSDSSSDSSSGSNSGSDSNGSGGSDNGSGGSDNGSDNIDKTVYYQIDFQLGGGISIPDALLPKALLLASDSIIDVNQLATPSVPGYVFEAWYYDSALTRQVQTGDRISGNITLYAKVREITGAEVSEGQDNYVASVDVDAKTFRISVLKPAGTRSSERAADIAKIYNLADQEVSLAVDISEPETVTIGDGTYEKYYLTSTELEAGTTYQMQLLSNSYFIYYEDQIQPAAVRLYNFTTAMAQAENLDLNSNLVYLKKTDVSYTEGSDYLSGLFTVSVKEDMSQLNTVDGTGSFTYTGDQKIGVGTTVVIYDGAEAPVLGGEDGLKAAEQYDGSAAYVTISKIEGNTYYYGVAEAEDVLFTPDVLPLNVADDEDTSNTTVTIDTVKLDFSGSSYQGMGLDENTTVDVGDYLAFYDGSLETATELTYGRITAIAVSGEDTILTYEEVSESEVLDSMTVYSTEEMEFELDDDTARSIEAEIEQDAIDSGFATEAANYLATVALATEEMQSLAGEMGLQGLSLTREDGSAATQSDLQLMASNSVSVEGLQVRANVSRNLKYLSSGYSKNGANAQLEISFNVKIGSGKNQLTLKVAATFEQEILLNLNIKGKAVWGKKWIFRYIKDYSITTNLDAGSYTGVGITATILAEGKEPEYDWSTVDKNLSDQIHELMDAQDKFFNQDISSTGGGLAEKYADMLENNPDWIDLVNVNIFSNEARILAGIIVVGVQGDFVVSAKVNIMLGMSFQYSVAKRYTFTLNVFSKTSSSNCVDLTKSNYQFDLYVMGTLGLRAGIRLTVYAGLFSKKVASIGITAEAGAYVQMWGYFYYSTSWVSGSGKSTSASGAMLLEVGAYLEIRFLASAFNGRFKYAPVLYDKYWPLWNMGSVENVYGFNYETTAGEADDKDIEMGANTSVALPVDRMDMSYMNLRNGDTSDKNYTYSDFTITTTGNFTYENGIISVIPQDGSNEETGTIKLTWNGAPLSFTSKPLSSEMDIHWSDPSRKNSVSYELHGGTAYENGEALTDGVPGVEVITGARITAPTAELKKEYYTFGGWCLDAEGTTPWNFETDKVKENIVLHAKWIPVPYEINYELDGGTNSETNPAAYTIEDTVTLAAPEKAGYRFLGWNTEADGTGSFVTEIPAGSTGARTFYAQWAAVEQEYEIHHMLETVDGSGYEDTETTTASALTGETVTVGAEQSKAYTGFTYDASRTEDSTGIIPGEGPLVLKLYYSRNKYKVTFVSGTGADPEAADVAYQGKVQEPEAVSRDGYEFNGWYAVAETPRLWNFDEDIITEATELRAGWTAKTYNISFVMQGGIGGDSNVLATYDSALPVITVPARAGYQFTGYYDEADGGKQYYNADGSSAADWDKSVSETDGFVLYAHWEANSYEVAFNANGGEGTMENQSFVYGEDGQLSKNTLTREGYLFAGWAEAANADTADYADEAGVSNLTTEADATVTLYAVWQPVVYGVVFDGNGADGGSMETQQLTYDTEAALNLNAYQKTGYHFTGWATTADAESMEYDEQAVVKNLAATEDATVTLYAVWEANEYTVAFYPNGGEGTMKDQQFTYDQELTALSKNGYTRAGYDFAGWATTDTADTAEYKDGEKVRNLVAEQDGVLTLYAVWKAGSYQVSFDSNKGEGSSEPTTAEAITLTYGTVYKELPVVSRTGYDFAGWYTEAEGGTLIQTGMSFVQTEDSTLYAHWNAQRFKVSFDSNPGSGSSVPTTAEAIEVTYDKTYGSLPEVTREGYTFDGWHMEDFTKILEDSVVDITEDITLQAWWEPNSYKVTFHANNGKFTDDTTDQVKDQIFNGAYQLPEDPVRTGYTFLGWYTGESDGDQVVASDAVITAKDNDLYAHWMPNTYTVAFDANGGSGEMASQDFSYDEVLALRDNNFERTGYIFEGWAVEKNGTASYQDEEKVSNLTNVQGATVTLYAVWKAITYKVVFYPNGGSGSQMASQNFTYDEAEKELSANSYTRTGYTFAGWATTEDAADAEYTDKQKVQNLLDEDGQTITLYAVWKADSYTVSFDPNEGSGDTEDITVTYGKAYGKLPDVSRTGYQFAGWYTDKEEGTEITEESIVEITADVTLYAHWTANKFTVSFDTNKGSGSSTPTTVSSINVNYGDSYGNLPVTGRDGYTFNGWYTASSGGTEVKAATKVSLTADQTLYAHWTANSYTVTFNTGAGAFTDGTTSTGIDQTYDSNYQLPAEPAREGYTFEGWYTGSTAGTQVTEDMKMTTAGAHTLYAHWASVVTNDISVNVGGVTLEYTGTPVYATTDANGNVTLGGSAANYNIKLENGVLTLNNATIKYAPVSDYHNGAISATGTLTIVLAAGTTNTVTNTSSNSGISAWNCGIYVKNGPLTITGSGSLTANGGGGQSSHGISVDYGTLIVDGAAVTANGGNAAGSSGIYTGGNLEMKNHANVTAAGGTTSSGASRGIECSGTITITNSSGKATGNTVAMTKSPTMSGATITSGSYSSTSMIWTASN